MRAFKHKRDCVGNTNVMPFRPIITTVKTLADRLKHARKLRGLTQADLAKMAGCAQGTIGNVENGTRGTLRNLVRVASALSVSPEWLGEGRGAAPAVALLPGSRYAPSAPLALTMREPEPSAAALYWPFKTIDQNKLMAMPAQDLRRLEAAVIGAALALGYVLTKAAAA